MMMSFYCPICGEVKGLEDAQKELKVLTIERDKLLATILEQEAEIFRLATIVQELTE
jgi:hypothetical protein